jgi:dihydrolipoamide dehydrogenase
MKDRFDLTVVGGGPGGYVAAIRGAQLGLSVALVENDLLGGVCLNRGCIPTKTLLASASLLRAAGRAEELGVRIERAEPDVPAIFARKDRVVERLRGGVATLLAKRGVTVVAGTGRLVAPGAVEVECSEGKRLIESARVILATGSRPVVPGAFPYDGRIVITTREALEAAELPSEILVVGAGAVGCEFAGFYSAMGVDVTLVEMLPEILPGEDASAARHLRTAFKKQGVDVRVGTGVESIKVSDGRAVTELADGTSVETARVLLAMGRAPDIEGAGIPDSGVATDGRAVVVNERMETSVEGVHAIGDLVGGWMLAHVASREGVVAASCAAGRDVTMNYGAVPRCTFTNPEIASVGTCEKEARDAGVAFSSGRFSLAASGKALAEGAAQGFVKILCEESGGRVIGGVIVGPHASDIIHEVGLAVEAGLTFDTIAGMIHAHPTLAETVMEAAEAVEGLSIHSA